MLVIFEIRVINDGIGGDSELFLWRSLVGLAVVTAVSISATSDSLMTSLECFDDCQLLLIGRLGVLKCELDPALAIGRLR